MPHTFVIAELGSTWDRSPGWAAAMIRTAAQAGADACKVQWCSNPARMAARRNAPELAAKYEILRWPAEWHFRFSVECKAAGVEYMCTCYLPEDIAVIAPYVQRFKVSSFEAGDDAFLADLKRFAHPIIISLGLMSDRTMISLANRWEPSVSFLQCTSAYPCPAPELNLSVLSTEYTTEYLDDWAPDGLSDHSADIRTGMLAVAAGASILEVHVRPDDCPADNPDYPHSLTLEQFKTYVENVRWAEQAMGDGRKRVMPSEEPNLRFRVKGGD